MKILLEKNEHFKQRKRSTNKRDIFRSGQNEVLTHKSCINLIIILKTLYNALFEKRPSRQTLFSENPRIMQEFGDQNKRRILKVHATWFIHGTLLFYINILKRKKYTKYT